MDDMGLPLRDEPAESRDRRDIQLVSKRQRLETQTRFRRLRGQRTAGTTENRNLVTAAAQSLGRLEHLMYGTGIEFVLL